MTQEKVCTTVTEISQNPWYSTPSSQEKVCTTNPEISQNPSHETPRDDDENEIGVARALAPSARRARGLDRALGRARRESAPRTMRAHVRGVDAEDGTRVELFVVEPTTTRDGARGDAATDWFILLHAHPKLGGDRTMMTPLARALSARGYGAVCVAARGTSGSSGSSSWRGSASEGVDACAAVDWATKTGGGDGSKVRAHVVGYSYGSTIGAWALDKREAIASYVAIGYPRGGSWWNCGVMGAAAKWLMRDHFEALRASSKPKLFVHPSRDEFTSTATMERFVREKLQSGGKTELRVLNGHGHFTVTDDDDAVATIAQWIEEFVRRVVVEGEGED